MRDIKMMIEVCRERGILQELHDVGLDGACLEDDFPLLRHLGQGGAADGEHFRCGLALQVLVDRDLPRAVGQAGPAGPVPPRVRRDEAVRLQRLPAGQRQLLLGDAVLFVRHPFICQHFDVECLQHLVQLAAILPVQIRQCAIARTHEGDLSRWVYLTHVPGKLYRDGPPAGNDHRGGLPQCITHLSDFLGTLRPALTESGAEQGDVQAGGDDEGIVRQYLLVVKEDLSVRHGYSSTNDEIDSFRRVDLPSHGLVQLLGVGQGVGCSDSPLQVRRG
mmetsp:Transcript_98482/g.263336  ORF Transcript_98482/g.263336 Transcript_98482/m.263336 type:complete len:276 (+) Transcript_98482:336-1163(+)